MTSEAPDDVRVALVTAPDDEVARQLARTLVDERLAACASCVPGITSVYRWEDAIQEDAEVLIMLKTCADRAEALAERVLALHPYDVPEVIWLPVSGGAVPYLDWVRREVAS